MSIVGILLDVNTILLEIDRSRPRNRIVRETPSDIDRLLASSHTFTAQSYRAKKSLNRSLRITQLFTRRAGFR